ncbi:class I SAM-dependent methyltransferase [Labilibacter marinus]|uniref:class I SAM-dependent methyltransferase n=1 Tax=Labilibacter marinus TaxID=1477105 RepID=UPI00082DE64E|nr:class I SAM-dependent methyltransferase [Labilibacter marinus]
MSFYSSIVKAYDEIFPLNKAQANFIESVFPVLSGKKVLDSGCGTGSLAIELGRRSASVDAFDLDGAMVGKALEKCPQAIDVRFAENDLLKFGAGYSASSFDIIYCLGNTLPHLPQLSDVKTYVDSAAKVLKSGGYLLIQIVNYDRVKQNEVAELPTIESDHYIFKRDYIHLSNGVIDFSTKLSDKNSGESYSQSVPLIPILKKDMDALLKESFTDIQYFGSFKKEDWSVDSFHTVVLAKKCTGQKV